MVEVPLTFTVPTPTGAFGGQMMVVSPKPPVREFGGGPSMEEQTSFPHFDAIRSDVLPAPPIIGDAGTLWPGPYRPPAPSWTPTSHGA